MKRYSEPEVDENEQLQEKIEENVEKPKPEKKNIKEKITSLRI